MWRCTYYARTAVRIHPFGASMFIYQVQFMGTLHVRTPNKEASKRLGLFVLCRHKCWLLYYHALVFARVYRNFDSCILRKIAALNQTRPSINALLSPLFCISALEAPCYQAFN